MVDEGGAQPSSALLQPIKTRQSRQRPSPWPERLQPLKFGRPWRKARKSGVTVGGPKR